ncbi:MAG: oxygen-independent coproporphyrinogen III oxidase [Planctomycetes bacterium]|nr:oxygen-independent coproporphyrinogen III oxidase [Planctomycetota bacterium]MBI3845519.1 oxygen-independent coproporphyrinogen III oxidase [Planctomycetota bacterium]
MRFDDQRVTFPAALLAKYNVAGPRYTSYPTAPEWTESVGADDLVRAIEAPNAPGDAAPLSLYMHLPYCEALCLYCGCNVVITKDHARSTPYLDRLKREIDAIAKHVASTREVVQFHWGGGTPTYFSPAELEDLFAYTAKRFRFSPRAEIGVEIDPRVTSDAHVDTLRRLGFNRLSMGVQDFDARVQETVHRVQPYAETKRLLDRCRAIGFDSINVDLIYGLPHQTAASFEKTVDLVIGLRPDRIAMFSYAHVPWLKKQQGSFAKYIPDGAEKFAIFRSGLERFTTAGYAYIGFDHFAHPNDELCIAQRQRTLHRNFQGYTTQAGADLVGMGVSAISGVGRIYAQNARELDAYSKAIDEGRIPTMRGFKLSDDDVIRRTVIGNLLCHCILFKSEIETQFGIRFDDYFAFEAPRLRELATDGLVRLEDDRIAVTPLGRVFLRIVGMTFDRYLREPKGSGERRFSKTL